MMLSVVPDWIPTWIKQLVVKQIPNARLQRLIEICSTMDRYSRIIFHGKKAALEKGEHDVVHQIDEGKDVLSILSKPLFEWW